MTRRKGHGAAFAKATRSACRRAEDTLPPTRPHRLSRVQLRILGLLATLLLIVGYGCGGIVGKPPPGGIATACGFVSTNVRALTPRFECIALDARSFRHAIFSYDNADDGPVVVPLGADNQMSPLPGGRGQPTRFARGARVGAFSVPMPDESLAWSLGTKVALADTAGRVCGTVDGAAEVIPSDPASRVSLHQPDAAATTGALLPSAPHAGDHQGTAAGREPGVFTTGNDGSARYSLPLWVPPGRAGIQPELAIAYDSNGGDGQLGMGFSLRGLSQITRCPRTYAIDGNAEPIRFVDAAGANERDKLCLDGNPLIPASTATIDVGPAKIEWVTEYRTRFETYSKITVDGFDPEGGPTSFTVFHKDGRIYRYGTRPESVLENLLVGITATEHNVTPPMSGKRTDLPPPDQPTVDTLQTYRGRARLAWALSEVSDRNGNGMTIDYALRAPDEAPCASPSPHCAEFGVEQLPIRISYTTLGTQGPATRAVRFDWRMRAASQMRDRWVRGFHLSMSHLLAQIEMDAPAPIVTAPVRSYRLSYEASPLSGRARLTGMQECDGSGACKQPVSMTWTNAAVVRTPVKLPGGRELDYPGAHPYDWHHVNTENLAYNDEQFDPSAELLVLDINGDGFDDLLFRSRYNPDVDQRDPPGLPPGTADRIVHLAQYYYRLSDGHTLGPKTGAGIPGPPNDPLSIDQCLDRNAPHVDRSAFTKLGAAYQLCMPAMPVPIDVDMDGRMELHDGTFLYHWNDATARYERSDDHGADGVGPPSDLPHQVLLYVADVDGDQMPDLMPIGPPYGSPLYHNNLGRLDGHGFFKNPLPVDFGLGLLAGHTFVGDWSGSGRGAFLTQHSGEHRYRHFDLHNVPGGLPLEVENGGASELLIADGTDEGVAYLFPDLNGDGLDDAIQFKNSELAVNQGQFTNLGVGFWKSSLESRLGLLGSARSPLDPSTKLPQDMQVRLLDDNRDGIPELVGFSTYYAGDHFDWKAVGVTTAEPAPAPTGYSPLAVLDVNGDGIADILTQPDPNDSLVLYASQPPSAPVDLLRTVDDAGELTIDYSPAHGRTANDFCGKGQLYCLTRGRWVVATAVRKTSAPEVVFSQKFEWKNPLTLLQGVGFTGFDTRVATDLLTGAVTETNFDNIGLPLSGFPGTVLSQTETTNLGDRRVVRRTVYSYDIGAGTLARDTGSRILRLLGSDETVDEVGTSTKHLRHVTTQSLYDEWGNVQRQQLDGQISDVHRRVQVTYENRPSEWLLGLPVRVDLTAVSPTETEHRSVASTFDGRGRLFDRTFEPDSTDPALRLRTHYEYTEAGLVAQVTSSDETSTRVLTSVMYDATEQMFPELATDAVGHVNRSFYHRGLGVLLQTIDPNGQSTTRSYDGFGRLRHIGLPNGTAADTTYVLEGGTTTVSMTNSIGHALTTRYDEVGRMIDRRAAGIDARDRLVELAYSDAQHPFTPTMVSLPHFVGDPSFGDEVSLDALGRIVARTHADGSRQRWFYDGMHVRSLSEVGDEDGVERDELGRIVFSTQLKGLEGGGDGRKPRRHEVVTAFSYSPLDELRQVVDPDGNVRSFTYDARGRRTIAVDPDSGEHDVHYDAFGDVVESFDGAGVRSTFEHDALGRTLVATTKDGTQCFEYDTAANGVGRLASATNDDVREELQYDALGRAVAETWTIGGDHFTVGAEYDALGRVGAVVYPAVAGASAKSLLAYDAHGMLAHADFQSTAFGGITLTAPVWSIDKRDAAGRIVDQSFGNGLETVARFDARRDVLRNLETTLPGKHAHPVQSLRYAYRADGALEKRTDLVDGFEETFDYDGMHELVRWDSKSTVGTTAATTSVAYRYDDIGNLFERTATTKSGVSSETFGVGEGGAGPHAMTSASYAAGAFRYDPSGNQIASPTRAVTYTAAGLPKEISSAAGASEGFTYDAFDARIRKVDTAGVETTSIGPYERRVSGDTSLHVFHLPGGSQVTWTEKAGVIVARQTLYVHPDHLGSASVVTDETGAVVERRRFEPFGQQVDVANPLAAASPPAGSSVTVGFTGQEQDADVGLVNMRGRVYDPRSARFLTPDPVVSGPLSAVGWNRYAYVWNDPLNLVDPSGFDPCDASSASCLPTNASTPDTLPDSGAYGPGANSGAGSGSGSKSANGSLGGGISYGTFAPRLSLPTVGFGVTWLPGVSGGDNNRQTARGNNDRLEVTNSDTDPRLVLTPRVSAGPAAPTVVVDQEYANSNERYLIVNGTALAWQAVEYTLVIDSAIATAGIAQIIWGEAAVAEAVGTLTTIGGETLAAGGGVGAGAVKGVIDNLPEVEAEVTTVATEATDVVKSVAPSGRALGPALEEAGFVRGVGEAAHHIVARTASAAEPARAVLRAFGIPINSAVNGVFLPAFSPNASGAMVHATLHTARYYNTVNEILLGSTSREQVIDSLGAIRNALLGGGL